MDERKKPTEQSTRRKRAENPLIAPDGLDIQENQKKNVYKLRILTIILVLLIVALIAAFVSEIGIYGKQGKGTPKESAAAQTEQVQPAGDAGSLAGL